MQLEIMANGGVSHQNRGFHWRAIAVGENSTQRDLNDVSDIELNFMGFRCIGESIERLLHFGFEIFDNTGDLVNLRLID
jgi:hypothetical protein